jgi:hypothetical protein
MMSGMPRTSHVSPTPAGQLSFGFVPEVIPQGDGSFRVSPGRPVCKVTVRVAARLAGVSIHTIYRLRDAGLLRGERLSPKKILIDVDSLQQHATASRDGEYWNTKRVAEYRARALKK